MKGRKPLLAWLKHTHGVCLILLYIIAVAAIVGSILMLTLGSTEFPYNILSYALYGVAAILLGYTVYTIVVFAPIAKKRLILHIQKHPFANRMMEQYGFRTIVFSIATFTISLANAALNGIIGISYRSVWYIALGAYYLLLSVMRGGVLMYHKNRRKLGERAVQAKGLKTYRTCGILLILLPLALSFVILEIVATDRAFVHLGLMIYAAAAYTFYKITMSIINFFKARKGNEMTVRAIRNINLADALVSVLALQTAMFHAFSPTERFGLANALTGAGVCVMTIAIGVVMVIMGNREIKKLKQEERTNGQEQI